jgi:outer membrane autotransporter protein
VTIGNTSASEASLTIRQGGILANSLGRIGESGGSSGTVTVTGDGSKWINHNSVYVGNFGNGRLNVTDGGEVTNDAAYIGRNTGSNGEVSVTGKNSSWINNGWMYLGYGGMGKLTIADGGTVTNFTSYIGIFDGSEGSAATVSGQYSTWNNTELNVGYQATGTLTIADGGTVQVGGGTGIVRIARVSGSFGTLDIGGAPAVAPGTLLAGSVAFGAGTGVINFNHASTKYDFAPTISGYGTINVHSGTTSLTGNSAAFSGSTKVTGGRLAVNGALGGTINVWDSGILGGSGTVGTTTIASGGTIAPGNSIGTLTVDGDLTFKHGSVYQVEVDPTGTSSDLIVVNGVARLAGTVMHVGQDGDYQPQSEYRILTATGGFDGTTFDGVSSKYTFLSPLLAYSAHDVTLRLERNQVAFASVATTPNQSAAAGGLDSLSAGNPLYDAVVKLDGPGAQDAFDQLSGEAHASGLSTLIGGSGSVRSIVSQRFQSSFGNRGTASVDPLTSYASYGSSADSGRAAGYATWGQVFGSWGRTSGDSRTAGVRHDDGGFLVGADAILAETWSVGAFAGYGRSTFSVRDRNSSGSSDNFHLGFHGGTEIGSLRLNVGAAHSWHGIDTSRTVAFPGYTDQLSASYRARTAQIFGEAGYRLAVGTFGTGALSVEPFAGLAYVHTTTNGFSETGGAAALTAAGSTSATTFSTLGLRAFSQFEAGGMQATLRGMVGWRHGFGNTVPTTRFSFAGGNAFSVSGTPAARNTALVEAGLDLAIRENVTLGLSYDGQYSRGSHDHGVNARLRVAF